jgi:competence ComEA-like helix-hairpin-helix protein
VEGSGSPASSGRRPRAYLLISLILLVWNTAAAARHAFETAFLPEPGPVAGPAPTDGNPDRSAPPSVQVSARRGPLSIRQKYLLGKRVDINHATEEEISELPGISDQVAAAVVAERSRRGGFRSPRDLLSVRGIKEKRLEKILPFLSEIENN